LKVIGIYPIEQPEKFNVTIFVSQPI